MINIGIDLGTTNTVAAINARVFEIDPKSGRMLPSVIAFPPTGTRLIGTVARRRRPIDPPNTIYSAKRVIGKKWFSHDAKEFCKRYPFKMVEEDGCPSFETRSGRFNPTDVAAVIMQRVCLRSNHPAGQITGIITVPSTFQAAEREATIEAGKLAGMAEVKILDEPTAAALAYMSVTQGDIKRAAVYDLGGGTFDMAVLDCSGKKVKVLGSGGDIYLGGDDIDTRLANWVADEMLKTHNWDYRSEQQVYARLILECEQAKIRLCKEEKTDIDLTRVDLSSPFTSASMELDRKKLALLCGDLVRRTFLLCDEVLGKVGIKPREVDTVFVVGGPTQLPMFQKGIEEYFQQHVRYMFDPMFVVAIGASIAGHLF